MGIQVESWIVNRIVSQRDECYGKFKFKNKNEMPKESGMWKMRSVPFIIYLKNVSFKID